MDKWADRHLGRWTNGHTDTWAEVQMSIWTNGHKEIGQTDKRTDGQINKQILRQMDKWADRHLGR